MGLREENLVTFLDSRFGKMFSDRSNWENEWQDVVELVRPNTTDFRKEQSKGETRTEAIYDSTAVDALEQLAAALQSFLVNPADRWFDVSVANPESIREDSEAREWLQEVTQIIYDQYTRPSVYFNMAFHEGFLDVAAFGTSCIYQEWNRREKRLSFRAYPLADVYVKENHEGRVDTVYRKICYTRRQIAQFFGEENVPPKVAQHNNDDQEYTLVHCVFPRNDRNPAKLNARNMEFASVWYVRDTKEFVQESGFKSLPYHCPRWSKLSNEVYGRSPALQCLPDIKMVNRMEYTNIKAAQKMVDPPLIVSDDGVILPLKARPGDIIFKEPGVESPEPLQMGSNIPVALEITNQKRDLIQRCFHADWIRLGKETVEMTAFETADRREEKLRLLSPVLGRLQTELLGPTIQRSYELMNTAGMLPPPPPSLEGNSLTIEYISPAARAQMGIKAFGMARYLQELVPMAQIQPDVMDRVDTDKYAAILAETRGVDMRIIRSDEDVAAIRQGRQEEEQMAQLAGAAEPISKSIKNLADANAKGGAVLA